MQRHQAADPGVARDQVAGTWSETNIATFNDLSVSFEGIYVPNCYDLCHISVKARTFPETPGQKQGFSVGGAQGITR